MFYQLQGEYKFEDQIIGQNGIINQNGISFIGHMKDGIYIFPSIVHGNVFKSNNKPLITFNTFSLCGFRAYDIFPMDFFFEKSDGLETIEGNYQGGWVNNGINPNLRKAIEQLEYYSLLFIVSDDEMKNSASITLDKII